MIIATLPAVLIAFILYGLGTAIAILIIGILLNALMDNAVTPRIMGQGLNLPILLVFLSFLFWSWVFGFVGALLALPATLFVRSLLQGRQETRFLVVLLSGSGDSDAIVPMFDENQDESNKVEEHNDTFVAKQTTVKTDTKDHPIQRE